MAKTSYVSVSPAEETAFFKNLTPQDRFYHSRLTTKKTLFSRKVKKGITQRSLLPTISELWAGFSESEKTAWSNAGAQCGLNGWRLFVQDQCARIKNELSGVATPSLLHQSWIGNLKIDSPATELKIEQLHPQFYWISQPVTGKKGMREPVKVTEYFTLPLKISLNYSADLSSVGGGSFAKFYAEVWSLYQGRDIMTTLEIDLDLSCAWQNAEATLSSVIGRAIRYDLYFHLYNVQGNLYIDNVKAEHNAQNWVRDTYCKDIYQAFTRAFYQIPKHWVAVILPSGAEFESIYKDF